MPVLLLVGDKDPHLACPRAVPSSVVAADEVQRRIVEELQMRSEKRSPAVQQILGSTNARKIEIAELRPPDQRVQARPLMGL
jgi:hypothetical protein